MGISSDISTVWHPLFQRNGGFWGGRKTGEPGGKPSKLGREPTTNSTHI